MQDARRREGSQSWLVRLVRRGRQRQRQRLSNLPGELFKHAHILQSLLNYNRTRSTPPAQALGEPRSSNRVGPRTLPLAPCLYGVNLGVQKHELVLDHTRDELVIYNDICGLRENYNSDLTSCNEVLPMPQ